MIARRGFITGLASLVAAPAIVKAEFIMPARSIARLDDAWCPVGMIPCDGRVLSRAAYRGLFEVIGTTFGAGDAHKTFNLPDMRGRVAPRVRGMQFSTSTSVNVRYVIAAHPLGVTPLGAVLLVAA